MDLEELSTTPETLEAGLGKLNASSLSASRTEKIETLMRQSRFGEVYTQYYLADDPLEFRRNLPHNVLFRQQASQIGINLDMLAQGIPDEGVEIEFNHSNVAGENKAKRLLRTVFQFMSDAQAALQPRMDAGSFDEMKRYFHKDDFRIIENFLTKKPSSAESMEFCVGLLANFFTRNGIFFVYDDMFIDAISDLASKVLVKSADGTSFRKNLQSIIDGMKSIYQEQINEIFGEVLKDDFLGGLYQQFIITGQIPGKIQNYDLRYSGEQIEMMLDRVCDIGSIGAHHICIAAYEAAIDMERLDKRMISDHIKNAKMGRYFVKVEQKLPEDVVFGNDGGCCIAVDNTPGNGDSLPFYQLDEGTVVFGIYLQTGQRKPVRTGMVLSFVTKDNSNDPALLENSIELSTSMNPLDEEGLGQLVHHVTEYVFSYIESANICTLGTGNTDHNTGTQYIDPELLLEAGDVTLRKLPEKDDAPRFYNEVFRGNGSRIADAEGFSFVLRDD